MNNKNCDGKFWFYFVIGLPMFVVFACLVTFYIAIKTDDDPVSKN